MKLKVIEPKLKLQARLQVRLQGQHRIAAVFSLGAIVLLLSGCSLLFGGRSTGEQTPEEAEDRVIVPTFTPTPELPPTATPEPIEEQPAVVEVVPTVGEAEPADEDEAAEDPAAEEVAAESPTTSTVDAPTPTPIPKIVVSGAAVNARNGPGTNYGLVGSVTQGQAFDAIGKNPDGTWWQFCCVNGQDAWIFGELVSVDNSEAVPVAQNIPAPPVAVAQPTPVPQAPAEPPPAEPEAPAEPPPAEPEAEAAPPGGAVNAGACGGDDGCKFRITGGPSFADNGGFEMKLQLFFMHSGVDGGQPQGDYRLAVERDGQLINVFADTTSIALDRRDGPMGPYNYEAKIGASDLPGGSLEGTYYIWVLDGNRERDSEVFTLNVPPGQGEIWIQFDQG